MLCCTLCIDAPNVGCVKKQHAPPGPDRREALKARHRRAILDAAAALMDQPGGTDFTVDALAERADVSRRTVFNHFASVEDIFVEVFGEVLGGFADHIDAKVSTPATGTRHSVSLLDQVTEALRDTDMVTPIAHIKRMLGNENREPTPREAAVLQRVVSDLGERTSRNLRRHYPSADGLTVDFFFGSLMSGLIVVYKRWNALTGGTTTEESRRVWDGLLDHLIATTRSGYGSLATALPAGKPSSPA